MHDQFSTQGGRVGFQVELDDGRTVSELDGTWDDVPRDARVKRLSVVTFADGKRLASLDGAERYFFCNEGLRHWDGRTALASKIFGGVKEGYATVIRVGLAVPLADLPFSDSAFRAG